MKRVTLAESLDEAMKHAPWWQPLGLGLLFVAAAVGFIVVMNKVSNSDKDDGGCGCMIFFLLALVFAVSGFGLILGGIFGSK